MPLCPWCEKEVPKDLIIEHPMPDDDYVEICVECSVKDEEEKESRFVTPRLKTQERTYARV